MIKILQTVLSGVVVAFVLFVQTVEVKANELEFQEKASEIILNTLQTEPKRSFLRKAYKELLFTPVWMRENSLSPAAKELFEYIRNDNTLNKSGKLYKDSSILEKMAEDMYASEENIYAKVSLEFKISQLYKGYTDYAYFGSINWGAFNARISNLMVNDVSTEWVLHRPEVYPAKMLGNAALGMSLKKQLDKAVPKAYHYKALQKVLEKSWEDITKAILVTSLFFVLVHLNPYWIVQIYLLGMLLGYLSWRTNSIIPGIILHGLNNGFAVALNNTENVFSRYYNWYEHVNPLWIFIAIILIIFGFKMLNKNLENQS